MVTHSSVLAWRIPGKAEPSGLLKNTLLVSLLPVLVRILYKVEEPGSCH